MTGTAISPWAVGEIVMLLSEDGRMIKAPAGNDPVVAVPGHYRDPEYQWQLQSLVSDEGEWWGFAIRSVKDGRYIQADANGPQILPVKMANAADLDMWAGWYCAGGSIGGWQSITSAPTSTPDREHCVLDVAGGTQPGQPVPTATVISYPWSGGQSNELFSFPPLNPFMP